MDPSALLCSLRFSILRRSFAPFLENILIISSIAAVSPLHELPFDGSFTLSLLLPFTLSFVLLCQWDYFFCLASIVGIRAEVRYMDLRYKLDLQKVVKGLMHRLMSGIVFLNSAFCVAKRTRQELARWSWSGSSAIMDTRGMADSISLH